MGAHIIDGEFQSDKYPTCPRGKVPLSVKDKMAQDLLWLYAERRCVVDMEFMVDLHAALLTAGYKPSADTPEQLVREVEFEVNDRMGGDATVREVVNIVLRRIGHREAGSAALKQKGET